MRGRHQPQFWLVLLSRSPGIALAVFAIASATALAQLWDFEAGAPRLRVETAVNRILPDDDEERRFYDRFRERFGNDESVLLVLIADDILTIDKLERIRRITERVEALPGVRRVVSVANALDVRAAPDGVRVEAFLEEMPRDPSALDALRKRVYANPVYAGSLVSYDGRASVLVIHPDEMSETEFRRRGIDHAIVAIAEQEKGDADVVLGGAPPVKATTSRLILWDALFSASAGLVVTALIGFVAFRTAWGALLALVCVGFGQIWALGAMAFLDRPLHLVTAVVPTVVNAVGIAYGMHVIAEIEEVLRQGVTGRSAVWTALGRVAAAVLLCAVTTMAGFLSLCTSHLAAIRDFGLFCAIGTAASCAAALWFLPCLLALFPPKLGRKARPSKLPERARQIAGFDLRHRGFIFAASAALAVVALVGVARIEVSTSLVHNLSPEHPLRVGFARLDEHMRGSNTINVVVETDREDAFKTPDALRELQKLQRWLGDQPEVGHTTSIADYVMLIHRAFHGDDPSQLRVPDSERLVEQLFYFFWDEQLDRLVDEGFAAATIEVRVSAMESAGYAALVERIETRLRDLPVAYAARTTGNTVLVVHAIDDIARSQARSLSIGLLSIAALLVVYFRSLRVGLIALIPNLLPVLCYFGALGLSGVTLNPTTSLVACLVLGVAVDDTLHTLARYRGFVQAGLDSDRATVEALRTVVRPIVLTTVVLCVQLLVLATSELKHQVEFGVLAAAMLLLAGVLDFTLTPALATYLDPGQRPSAAVAAGRAAS